MVCHYTAAGAFEFNPRSKSMTARDERVVWTVPCAASDPLGGVANRLDSLPSSPSLSSVAFGRREGERRPSAVARVGKSLEGALVESTSRLVGVRAGSRRVCSDSASS